MSYVVYFLYSSSLDKYYIGITNNLDKRIKFHNSGLQRWTKRGIPWIIKNSIKVNDKTFALKLERKLKSYKSPKYIRYLFDKGRLAQLARALT